MRWDEMLVKEVFEECLHNQESSLAHYIYHLLLEKKISLDDDESKIDLNEADHQKVATLIENNVLGIHWIGIFSLKRNVRDFVLIFASSKEEAIQFYTQSFHQAPMNCHEQLLEFEMIRNSGPISFRNMKKEFNSFPAIAGYFRREQV
jgi:hypothetical protein